MVIEMGDGKVRHKKVDQILRRISVGSWEKAGNTAVDSSMGSCWVSGCIVEEERDIMKPRTEFKVSIILGRRSDKAMGRDMRRFD